MRYYFLIILSILFYNSNSQVKVNGYYKKNGTYVEPHYRSSPDGNPYNNYSFPGNTNPFTGKTATGDQNTYLKRYNKYYENNNLDYSYNGGEVNFSFDLGYQVNTIEPLGGYMLFNFRSFSLGLETGFGYKKDYYYENKKLIYDSYWASLIGLKHVYFGIGQILLFDDKTIESDNKLAIVGGYYNSIKNLSIKTGFLHSPVSKLQLTIGIGISIY